MDSVPQGSEDQLDADGTAAVNGLAWLLTGWTACVGVLDLGSHMKTSRTNRFNCYDTAVRDHKKLLHAPLHRISRRRRLQRHQPDPRNVRENPNSGSISDKRPPSRRLITGFPARGDRPGSGRL